MSTKTTANILVGGVTGLRPNVAPVPDQDHILLRLTDGFDTPVVLADTPAALRDLLARALAAITALELNREDS